MAAAAANPVFRTGIARPDFGHSDSNLNSPWFRFFLTYDPVPALEKVRCPVLALNGELDLQVPADANMEAMEKALRAGGNPDVLVKKLPGLNHLFQTAKTGSPAEYGSIEETMSPVALKAIGDWCRNLQLEGPD